MFNATRNYIFLKSACDIQCTLPEAVPLKWVRPTVQNQSDCLYAPTLDRGHQRCFQSKSLRVLIEGGLRQQNLKRHGVSTERREMKGCPSARGRRVQIWALGKDGLENSRVGAACAGIT